MAAILRIQKHTLKYKNSRELIEDEMKLSDDISAGNLKCGFTLFVPRRRGMKTVFVVSWRRE